MIALAFTTTIWDLLTGAAIALMVFFIARLLLFYALRLKRPTQVELEEREQDWAWPERHAGPKREDRLP